MYRIRPQRFCSKKLWRHEKLSAAEEQKKLNVLWSADAPVFQRGFLDRKKPARSRSERHPDRSLEKTQPELDISKKTPSELAGTLSSAISPTIKERVVANSLSTHASGQHLENSSSRPQRSTGVDNLSSSDAQKKVSKFKQQRRNSANA